MPNIVARGRTLARRLLRTAITLFAYDVFISYARRDGRAYARALHRALEREGIVTFLDKQEVLAGDALGPTLRGALRKSRLLVLVATDGARQSFHVRREVESFVPTRRPIVPVNFAGSYDVTQWPQLVDSNPVWIDEPAEALQSGPTPESVHTLRGRLSSTGSRAVARRVLLAGGASLVVLALLAGWAYVRAVGEGARRAAQEWSGRAVQAFDGDQNGLRAVAYAVASLAESPSLDASQVLGRVLPFTRQSRGALKVAGTLRSVAYTADGAHLFVVGGLAGDGDFAAVLRVADMGEVLKIQRPRIASAALARDGRLMAVATGEACAPVFDVASGARVTCLAHDKADEVVFSADGQWLATHGDVQDVAPYGSTVRLWSTATWSPAPMPAVAMGRHSMAFSPDGRLVAVGQGAVAPGQPVACIGRPHDSATCEPIAVLEAPNGPARPLTSADVVFSPDGRHVLVIDETTVRVVSVASRTLEKRIDDSRGISRARFSPDSRRVLVVASTGMASLHDVGDGHASNFAQFPHPARVADLQFSTDGARLITACDDGVVRVWDTGLVGEQNDYFQSTFLSGVVLHATNQNNVRRNRAQWVSSLAIAPKGGTFATAGDDGWVRFWSVEPAPEVAWTRHGQGVSGLAATADGQTLVSASEYAGRVWDITPLRLRRTLRRHGNDLSSAGISADGKVVMMADSEGKAFVFAGTDTAFVRAIEHEPGDDAFLHAVLSRDARLLATFHGPRGVKLWDPYSGRLVSRQAFDGPVRAVAFSPDTTRIAVAVDRAITTWTIEGGTWVAGQGIATTSPVRALAFDANGNIAAGEDEGRVSLWSKDGTLAWQVRQPETVSSVRFSQDGRALATGGHDRTARVWSAADGTEWARLSFPFRVSAVQFVGDHDQHLVVGGENYLYEVPWRTDDLRAVACRQLNGLDATTWERLVGDAPRAACGSADGARP